MKGTIKRCTVRTRNEKRNGSLQLRMLSSRRNFHRTIGGACLLMICGIWYDGNRDIRTPSKTDERLLAVLRFRMLFPCVRNTMGLLCPVTGIQKNANFSLGKSIALLDFSRFPRRRKIQVVEMYPHCIRRTKLLDLK